MIDNFDKNAGTVLHDDHGAWYQAMFSPSFTAGIFRPSDLAGFRNEPVYIRQSKIVCELVKSRYYATIKGG